jgi:hypothetical protein
MPKHVVVDGSNLATEGRSMPSLKQLNEAVLSYMEEHPTDLVTVVVDATFGHRIDTSEIREFDAAVENNELVSPPAGAVGRGDAFVLSIANKANATILSNDSFQEFHGEYTWLFDEGRLVGGKPVPHVGWVFVARTPVRGPISRRAVKAKKTRGKEPAKVSGRPSPLASAPMPVPKVPPPVAKGRGRGHAAAPAAAPAAASPPVAVPAKGVGATPAKHANINELLPFLTFVEKHPVGSLVDATVDSYSSHGAYGMSDGARCYIPMRFMADPPPRSAREVLALNETRALVVVSFNAARRGIDLAVPGFQPPDVVVAEAPPAKRAGRGSKRVAKPVVEPETPALEVAPAAAGDAKPAKSARGRKATKGTPAAPAAAPEQAPKASKGRGRGRGSAAAPPEAAPVVAPAPTPSRTAKKAASKRPTKKAAPAAPAPTPAAAPAPRAAKSTAKKAPAKKAAKAAKAPAEVFAKAAGKKAARASRQ